MERAIGSRRNASSIMQSRPTSVSVIAVSQTP
jgi:hypothetical protein